MLLKLSIFFLLIATSLSDATADQIFFVPGDASFVGIVGLYSPFLSGEDIIRSANSFCCARIPDTARGSDIDLSHLPPKQLAAARELIQGYLHDDKDAAVLVCICSSDFNFENLWLGVPYNKQVAFRARKREKLGNCFGPTGSANLSTRAANSVSALPVKVLSAERLRVTGEVSIAIVKREHIVLQRHRTVIASDGSYKSVQFQYQPKYRVCYEDGDAFFVGAADVFLKKGDTSVDLNYLRFPRRGFVTIDSMEGSSYRLDAKEMEAMALVLPVQLHGSRLKLLEVPESLAEHLSNKLLPEANREWFVFVVDDEYDPGLHSLGRRYNKTPFANADDPLGYEYLDCNFCDETYPVGLTFDVWPPELNVAWYGDDAEISINNVTLIFVKYWSDVYFYSNGYSIEDEQVRVVSGQRIEYWRDQKLVSTIPLIQGQ